MARGLDPTPGTLRVVERKRPVAMLACVEQVPVIEAQDGMRIEVNHVYVIPPNELLGTSAGILYLTKPGILHSAYAALDFFLRSLAQDQNEYAICMILSGTGSSGTLGLKAIKASEGAAFVQDPASAEFPQMPASAIATGLVDEVLTVERMPEALIEHGRRLRAEEAHLAQGADETSEALGQILALVADEAHIDLRGHRSKTLMRRIRRRMSLSRIDCMPEYVAYLREHRDEVARLGKDFLISVTQFFRDPEAFQILETTVIPELLARKPRRSAGARVGSRLRHGGRALLDRHALPGAAFDAAKALSLEDLRVRYRSGRAGVRPCGHLSASHIGRCRVFKAGTVLHARRRAFLQGQQAGAGIGDVHRPGSRQRRPVLADGPDQLPQSADLSGA